MNDLQERDRVNHVVKSYCFYEKKAHDETFMRLYRVLKDKTGLDVTKMKSEELRIEKVEKEGKLPELRLIAEHLLTKNASKQVSARCGCPFTFDKGYRHDEFCGDLPNPPPRSVHYDGIQSLVTSHTAADNTFNLHFVAGSGQRFNICGIKEEDLQMLVTMMKKSKRRR